MYKESPRQSTHVGKMLIKNKEIQKQEECTSFYLTHKCNSVGRHVLGCTKLKVSYGMHFSKPDIVSHFLSTAFEFYSSVSVSDIISHVYDVYGI